MRTGEVGRRQLRTEIGEMTIMMMMGSLGGRQIGLSYSQTPFSDVWPPAGFGFLVTRQLPEEKDQKRSKKTKLSIFWKKKKVQCVAPGQIRESRGSDVTGSKVPCQDFAIADFVCISTRNSPNGREWRLSCPLRWRIFLILPSSTPVSDGSAGRDVERSDQFQRWGRPR